MPSGAIVRVDDVAYVFGGSEDRLAALAVEIIAEDGISTYVRADLGAGVKVAVDGIAALKSVWLSNQAAGE